MTDISINLTDEERRAAERLVEADNPMAPMCQMALHLDLSSSVEDDTDSQRRADDSAHSSSES